MSATRRAGTQGETGTAVPIRVAQLNAHQAGAPDSPDQARDAIPTTVGDVGI